MSTETGKTRWTLARGLFLGGTALLVYWLLFVSFLVVMGPSLFEEWGNHGPWRHYRPARNAELQLFLLPPASAVLGFLAALFRSSGRGPLVLLAVSLGAMLFSWIVLFPALD